MKIFDHLHQGNETDHPHLLSSLLTRSHRGTIISIDNIRCKLKHNGEWTANRIELEYDFPGQTNLDAEIGAMITAEIVKKRSPKKNKAVPISSSDISGAVAGLDLGSMGSSRIPIKEIGRKKLPKKQTKPPSQSSSISDSLSDYSRALLSDRQSTHGNQILQPKISVNISENTSDCDDDSRTSSKNISHSSRSQLRHHLSHQSSPSARSIRSTSSKVSTSSKQSTLSSLQSTQPSLLQPSLVSASEIIATDDSLEPEQIQMLNEIDDITPEEQQRKRYQMNLRMADRVCL
jgi:hypothetical protein